MKPFVPLAAVALVLSGAASAQHSAQSSSSTPSTRDVYASTRGSGTSTPDSVEVSGGADAGAARGGIATTDSSARFNHNSARQRSVATARDEDERARSRTNTHVRRDGQVRSNSMSIYKERGEKPVIDRERSVSEP